MKTKITKNIESNKNILKIAKMSGSSFYWAIRLLPPTKRYAMLSIYAFCRAVDDIADGKGTTKQKLIKLKEWRNKIDLLYRNLPTDTVTEELANHLTKFELNKDDFLSIIDGMEAPKQSQTRNKNREKILDTLSKLS